MSSILACTDGSPYSASVYQLAAWAASRLSANVQVLHVLERAEQARGGDLSGSIGFDARAELLEELTRLDETHARVARLKGKAILEDAVLRLAAHGIPSAGSVLRHGSLVETLDEFEPGNVLLVIGKRGEHMNLAKGHLGSNLERVIRSATIPVLVAARDCAPIQRFMIAFDGGPSSLKAVEFVAYQPLLQGAECHLLAVAKPGADLATPLEEACGRLAAAGISVQAEILPGNVEDVIAAQLIARDAQLLLMGAYGHSRIRRLVIGSTTTSLIRTCKRPILLFR